MMSCMLFSINIQAQNVLPSGVQLDHDTIVLALGNDTTLVAHVLPHNTTNKTLSWIILENGLSVIDTLYTLQDTICEIQAISVGTVKIVVQTKGGGNFRDTCIVQVVIPTTDIALSHDTIRMFLSRDTLLVASVFPHDATDKSITWINTNPDVVFETTVDSFCTLTSLSFGQSMIYAVTNFGELKDSCVIEVIPYPIESLTLSADSIDIYIGSDTTLIAHLEPTFGINHDVDWKSLNESIVELVSSGYDTVYTIRAKALGIAHIVAISSQETLMTDTCVVTVHGIPAESVSLNHDTLVMHINTDTTLIAHILPHNTTNDSIEWVSADSAVVDIITEPLRINDTICVIRAVKADTVKIYAKTFDGGFKDSCVVIVIVPVDSVVMNVKSITRDIDDIYLLHATIYPDSATFKSLVWHIDNPQIFDTLSIENDTIAHIQMLKAGTATIYVSTPDGLCKDSCIVTVNPKPVESIKLNRSSLDLLPDSTFRLTATVLPPNASNRLVVWTSSDPSFVEITSTVNDSICIIKALKPGNAIVRAKTNDGAFKDSCVVTVLPYPITKMTLSHDSLTCYLNNDFNTFIYYLEVAIKPVQTTLKAVEWTCSDPTIVEVVTKGSVDTIRQIKPLLPGTATVFVRSLYGNFKDSCVITVKDQFLVLETDTVYASANGIVEISLIVPDNYIQAGSFELQLPNYFGLVKDSKGFKSALTNDFKDNYDLTITPVNDSIYLFDVSLKATASSEMKTRSGTVSLIKLMDISYTIYKNDILGSRENYKARMVDVVFVLDDQMTLEEKRIEFVIKAFRDPVGNAAFDKPAILSYFYNQRLFVYSEKAETIYVYSLNGQLLFTGVKKEGPAVFDLTIPEKTLVVRGSSGWANTIANQ